MSLATVPQEILVKARGIIKSVPVKKGRRQWSADFNKVYDLDQLYRKSEVKSSVFYEQIGLYGGFGVSWNYNSYYQKFVKEKEKTNFKMTPAAVRQPSETQYDPIKIEINCNIIPVFSRPPVGSPIKKPISTKIETKPELKKPEIQPEQEKVETKPVEKFVPKPIETPSPKLIETSAPKLIEKSSPKLIETSVPKPIETSSPKLSETLDSKPIETSDSPSSFADPSDLSNFLREPQNTEQQSVEKIQSENPIQQIDEQPWLEVDDRGNFLICRRIEILITDSKEFRDILKIDPGYRIRKKLVVITQTKVVYNGTDEHKQLLRLMSPNLNKNM